VFDAYGTLFDPDALTARLDVAFPGKGAAISSSWRAAQLRATWLISLMDRWTPFDRITADALRHACLAHGVVAKDPLVEELLDHYRRLPAYPDVTDALRRLPNPKVILSNGTAEMVRSAVTGSGLTGSVDAVLSSDEVRIYKPSPRIYALVTEWLGLPAEDITFVSGNDWDCDGAAAFGFHVVRIARSPGPEVQLGMPAPARIASLSELPAHLEAPIA